jgi:N-acetyl-anhydromuramyl-L-alanine amidase AmpD
MLEIRDVEYLNNIRLNYYKKETKKSQILLFDTYRRFENYTNKLIYRRNGNYSDTPHYIIDKLGHIYKIFDTKFYSDTFKDSKIDKKLVKIAIENLGWLNKNTITGVLNNWIGDPFRGDPFVKSWRNHFYWDKYTDAQMNSIAQLCDNICDNMNIPKKIVISQGVYSNVNKIEGVVCKSNFSDIYTDINPSFNFNIFFKNAEQQDNRI